MTIVNTERLVLTPTAASDIEDLITLWAHPEFTRHITGRPLCEDEVWLRCLRDIGHWQVLNHGNWVIRERSSGEFVGTVGVLNYRRTITPAMIDPELGWGLSPRFQKKGMALEAVTAALDWADRFLTAERTLCMITPENTASSSLAKRLGYQAWATTRYKDSEVILYERPRQAP